MKRVIRLDVEPRQKVAGVCFLVMTNLAIDIILGKPYINGNIDKINFNKSTLKLTGSSSVAIEESVGNAAYMTSKLVRKQRLSENEYYECTCTATCQ